MGTFRIVTREELKMRKKLSKEEVALFDQFKAYLSRINSKDAGIYEFSKEEDQEKCKKLVQKAAKALNVRLRIIKEDNSLVFYRRVPRGERK